MNITTENLLDLDRSAAGIYLKEYNYPYFALPHIKDIILKIIENLDTEEFYTPTPGVYISKSATVAPSAYIAPPAVIFHRAEIRHCAYIRGSVLVGNDCVVGNSTELKNCILFDNVDVPHFNYVGDSILGYKAHLGAGAIISNIKSDKKNVIIRNGDERLETGLRKMGAIVGDRAEIGCNSVLNPGTIIGRNSNVYPTSCVRGVLDENSIFKNSGAVIIKTK